MIEPDCEQIVDSLVEFSDGELPESEVARVEAHLGECAECQTRLEHLERSLALAREVWQESAEAAAEVLSDAARIRPVPWQRVLAASLAAAGGAHRPAEVVAVRGHRAPGVCLDPSGRAGQADLQAPPPADQLAEHGDRSQGQKPARIFHWAIMNARGARGQAGPRS